MNEWLNTECAIEGFTIATHNVTFEKYNEPSYIIPFGDVHRSSQNCHVEKWHEFLDWARNKKRAYFIGMGDLEDFLSHSERNAMQIADTQFHDDTKDTLEDLKMDMVEKMAKELDFMKGKLIGLIEGNHYATFKDGTSTTQRLCYLLKCKYLGCNALIRFAMSYAKSPTVSHSLDIYAHHGLGAARTASGSMMPVERMAQVARAQIYLQGHDHKKGIVPDSILALSDGNKIALKDIDILYIRTGSFLKAYEVNKRSYVSKKLLKPANLGVVKIEITPKRINRVHNSQALGKTKEDNRTLSLHASV
jgi:hypothetical protein